LLLLLLLLLSHGTACAEKNFLPACLGINSSGEQRI